MVLSCYYKVIFFIITFSRLIMNFIKFFSHHANVSLRKKCIHDRKILQCFNFQFYCTSVLNNPCSASEEDILNKIIYNEVLQKTEKPPEKFQSICLKYLIKENKINKAQLTNKKAEEKEILHFPYANTQNASAEADEFDATKELFSESVYNFTPSDYEKIKVPQWTANDYHFNLKKLEKPHKWAFSSHEESQDSSVDDVFIFGSCDPHQRVSSVPCGGCGALLHCNDATLPGFIPAEIFVNKEKDLKAELCQRCHFLRKFNIALGLNVSPSEYVKLISSVREEQALAIIMIDLLDFPCSIFPNILDLIGPKKPVVIVGNKVDLLIKDGHDFFENIQSSLVRSLRKHQIFLKNIKHIALISAKTGFGVEKLIDVLQLNWRNQGNIYLIGCTNVGKSSLFNMLLQSDLCKVKAVNLLQRATVSDWPGTTLNLLKFPLMTVNNSHLITRSNRISALFKEEAAMQKCQTLIQNIKLEQIPLQGYVGSTFGEKTENNGSLDIDAFKEKKYAGLNPDEHDFRKGNWFYDTPGVVNQNQIVNLLTTSELLLTVPKKMLLPRNFLLKPGNSLFIAGLARLDYINGPDTTWFTVYASMELPLTVTKLEDAHHVYEKLLGSPYFRVPMKGKERLSKWPSLRSKLIEISPPPLLSKKNKLLEEAGVDVVLSSAGWVCVTMPPSYRCQVEAWTPLGKGIFLRDVPLIKNGHKLRGKKIPNTPAFSSGMQEVKGFSLSDDLSY